MTARKGSGTVEPAQRPTVRLQSTASNLVSHVVRFAYRQRKLTSAAIHAVLIIAANYLAFLLRFDGAIPASNMLAWKQTILLLVLIRSAMFIPLRLYEGLWRYTSIWDIQRIIFAVVISSGIFMVLQRWVLQVNFYPRAVYLIDAVLLIGLMSGARLMRRVYREARTVVGEARVLVLGAGDAGEMIVRDMLKNPAYGRTPIGFVDDDPAKRGRRIHGVPVLGSRLELPAIIQKRKPDEILVAIPSEKPAALRRIAHSLQPYKIPISTLPSLSDIVQDDVSVAHIRPLAIEDLLARAPVGLDRRPLETLISGRRVMVTGAGGSIGSELCRQIVALGPSSLAALERHENSLYAIGTELADAGHDHVVRTYLADCTDSSRMAGIFQQFRPEIVFHAAAHKHVPMVEVNPAEGFRNNVLSTRVLAETAAKTGVERFVLISTDKAVNPTNVMGATKRVAELCIQAARLHGSTAFCAVRFGNVLASNGSVVPRFLDQIKRGGPVTVTHPDIRRYFMLIPEAVQLVMHAAAQAESGAVYVLEMGDQIKVADMARNLIRLSGFVPDEEIKLQYVGLRPGEKLYEELVAHNETAEPSCTEGIWRVKSAVEESVEAKVALVDEALVAALAGNDRRVVELLTELVPGYVPSASLPTQSLSLA